MTTEQPGSGTLSGTPSSAVAPESIGPAPEESPLGHAAALAHESFHGRPVSWVAVAIITIGFVIGGIALLGFIVAGFARVNEDWY